MATRYGSDRSFLSTNTGGVYDTDGNEVISSSNQFGSFPLGPAALAQTLFSVPNGTFNLLPPDLSSNVGPDNPLPYWDIPLDNSDNLMSSSVIFDTTTNTYALRLTPGTALSGDTYAITTRSAVISDDNLALRQKAIATLEKVGTYAGATQVNLSLSATYYDALGSAISTQAIGTVFDNGTISSITGFTTAGTAAVGISASYVDLTFTMTATANVSSGISFDINTILLQTSQGAGGSSSFLVTESFTSSTTWVRPTGVDYLVGVIAVGAGGGGGGGAFAYGTAYRSGLGGAGGGGGGFALVQNLYVGDAGSVSIGVGASGAGGTTIAKSGTAGTSGSGGAGAAGGATTFGAYITANGGNGGAGGILSSPSSDPVGTASGGSGGTASNRVVGGIIYGGTTGASTGTASTNGSSSSLSAFTYVPFVTTPAAGASGGTARSLVGASVGTATAGAAAGYQGGGGGGGGVRVNASTYATWAAKSAGAGGAGGGGAHFGQRGGGVSGTMFAGEGGSASPSSGAGGGGGGACIVSDANSTGDRANAGTGGVGATGFVIIAYVG
jgi:hypothetical protein